MASKITEWVKPNDASGEFKRQRSSFRDFISSAPGAKFPPEVGRYHLYVSYACPWACRTLIARKLKGLEDIISFSVVHWHMGEGGWRFVTNVLGDEDADVFSIEKRVMPDPIVGHSNYTHLRDVYLESEPNYDARATVPVLYDKKHRTIVSNESSEILRMLNSEFNALIPASNAAARSLDLYPEAQRESIDADEEWHYSEINNGVYKTGFATTQTAYERHVRALFSALDRAEKHLAATQQQGQRFWFPGDAVTEVDIRLYVTMIRFDPVYVQHFKCNLRDVRSGYPAIHRWMRGLYWTESAFKDTTDFEHIKLHYTKSHSQINPHAVTPLGPLPNVLPLDEEVAVVKAISKA